MLGLLDGVRDGLLEQDVLDAGRQGELGGLNMERVGQCDRHCVQILLLKKQRVIVVQRNAQFLGNLLVVLAEAGHGHQIDFRIRFCVTGYFRALVKA